MKTRTMTDRRAALQERLREYIEKSGSKAKAATRIGVAASTLSLILDGKWESISEEMLNRVESRLSGPTSESWVPVVTHTYAEVTQVLDDMREWRASAWVIAPAGAGKSTTARLYAEAHPGEAYYILCSEDMRRRDFLEETLRTLGTRTEGLTDLRSHLRAIEQELEKHPGAVLIFDEADKLLDSIMLYFVTLYNHLEGQVGMVFLSTSYMEKRMRSGLSCNKRGYNELHSRIGRRFVEITPVGAEDVTAICRANGVTDRTAISAIIRDAAEYEYDLRRVRRAVMRELVLADR